MSDFLLRAVAAHLNGRTPGNLVVLSCREKDCLFETYAHKDDLQSIRRLTVVVSDHQKHLRS